MNKLQTLGDLHLGKKFRTGVPLNRIGHREAMVWADFEDNLMHCTSYLHVQMGDLFDTFAVEEAVVLRAAEIYKEASKFNPATTYVVIRGNHDASRDVTKASSFDVFAELMQGYANVLVMKDVTQWGGYGFIPWHPFKSSTELAMELLAHPHPCLSVFGHWDVQSFGGEDFNLVPTNVLKAITKKIYTGHIHLPTTFERDGVEVVVVGSMQPYSHSEDATGRLYVTMKAGEEVGGDFHHKNVRLLIEPDTTYVTDQAFDCLSLTTKKTIALDDEEPDLDVSYDSFDMHSLFRESLTEAKVGPAIASKILEKYEELKNV